MQPSTHQRILRCRASKLDSPCPCHSRRPELENRHPLPHSFDLGSDSDLWVRISLEAEEAVPSHSFVEIVVVVAVGLACRVVEKVGLVRDMTMSTLGVVVNRERESH